jgi:hypothetical protein
LSVSDEFELCNYKQEVLKKLTKKKIQIMDPKFEIIAENQLGETKIKRLQALKQLNDWLDKHPFIVNITRGEK